MRSGTESTTSRRPSRSKSTAYRLNAVGMNWVGPNAPAHEPTRRLGPHVAALEDFQRGQKLLAEIILPAADAGERRGRADHRTLAAERAVIGLDAPDRGDDMAVDAVGSFHRIEGRAIFFQQRAALRDALVVHQEVEIVPERLGELRLTVEQIHDPQIGRQPRGIGGEGRRARCRAARPPATGARGSHGNSPPPRGWRSAVMSGWPEAPDSPAPFRRACRRHDGDRRDRAGRRLENGRRAACAAAAPPAAASKSAAIR